MKPPYRPLAASELDALRDDLRSRLASPAAKLPADPEEVQRSVARVVLTLVEFLRELMERQALRRLDAETLSPEEIESLGLALMRLEETVREIAARFGLAPEDLNLDLGPLGRVR
jgi:hypothetical protein